MEAVEKKYRIAPKALYRPLYNIPKEVRIIDLWGGRGRGGSHEATLYAYYRFTSPIYSRIAFVRKILGDVRTSLWQDFKDRVEGSGQELTDYQVRDTDMYAYNPITKNSVKAFGAKADGGRTAKLKSLAGFNVVIIEEAEEFAEEEFDQIEDSLRTVKGDIQPIIIRIFNPPGTKHWIWKDYNLMETGIEGYWKAEKKVDSKHLISIFSTYHDNKKYITKSKWEKWEGYKVKRPWMYYTVTLGLIQDGLKGRIYNGWQAITDQEFKEIDKRSIYWLDFGWSESPMAFGEMKFENNSAYMRELVYKPSSLKDFAIRMCELGIGGSELIIADHAQKDFIYKLRTGWAKDELTEREIELYPQLMLGFNVSKCYKGERKNGILAVQDMDIYATEDSMNIWAEYQEYSWALDKNKEPTDTPKEGKDHHMDGIRYVVTGRGRIF